MTTFSLTLLASVDLRHSVHDGIKRHKDLSDDLVTFTLDDELTERIASQALMALPSQVQTTLLATLAQSLGCVIVTHELATALPTPVEPMDSDSRSGSTRIDPVSRFLPCLTPVGPGKCLHPGSHHRDDNGACTHQGCACDGFSPDMIRPPKAAVATESVRTYLMRLMDGELLDPSAYIAEGLQRAFIPPDAPASDWWPMLGRAFPLYADAFAERPPQ